LLCFRSMAPADGGWTRCSARAKESSSASERAFDRQQMPDAKAHSFPLSKTTSDWQVAREPWPLAFKGVLSSRSLLSKERLHS
jgi:hypothetical protein